GSDYDYSRAPPGRRTRPSRRTRLRRRRMRLDTERRGGLRGLGLVARAVAEEPTERRAEREPEPLQPCGWEREADVAEVMLRDDGEAQWVRHALPVDLAVL